VPWAALVIGGVGTFAVLAVAGWLATRALIGRERAGRLSRVPSTESGARRESVTR
jgi:hypothetical protein